MEHRYGEHCEDCKFWKLTSNIIEYSPSGRCNYLKIPHEGYGTHAKETPCNAFERK